MSTRSIKQTHGNRIFDSADPEVRRKVRLDSLPLLNEDGQENYIFDANGGRIPRREPDEEDNLPACGVLVDLSNIQALFDPFPLSHDNDDSTTWTDVNDATRIDAYPLAFLRTIGNVQADGIPPCFYPLLTEINKTVRKRHGVRRAEGSDSESDAGWSEEGSEGPGEDSFREDSSGEEGSDPGIGRLQAVKPVSAQFYNYMTHRVAIRAGKHDAQQGTVTAAISGGFAKSEKHKEIASKKQSYCDRGLPSDRFHSKISLEDCPTSCRAEFVYSVDVRALKNPSGTHVSFHSFKTRFS